MNHSSFFHLRYWVCVVALVKMDLAVTMMVKLSFKILVHSHFPFFGRNTVFFESKKNSNEIILVFRTPFLIEKRNQSTHFLVLTIWKNNNFILIHNFTRKQPRNQNYVAPSLRSLYICIGWCIRPHTTLSKWTIDASWVATIWNDIP